MYSYQGLTSLGGLNGKQEEAPDLPELGVENERLKTTITILNLGIKMKDEDLSKIEEKL